MDHTCTDDVAVPTRTVRQFRSGWFIAGMLILAVMVPGTAPRAADPEPYQDWIAAMKLAPRGPFKQIRWFCKDGAVLPPGPNACDDHGGGTQHGEWTDRVKALRDEGYYVANTLAGIDATGFLADNSVLDLFPQIIVEHFLIATDDGWILRQARYYRGALQEEGERRGARRLLFKMAEDRDWLDRRYPLLRTGARLLAHGAETDQVTMIRQRSMDLAQRDRNFQMLRNKIHVYPEPGDADAVRAYASTRAPAELVTEYEALAAAIQSAYQNATLPDHLNQVAGRLQGLGDLPDIMGKARAQLLADGGAENRFRVTADLLRQLRDRIKTPNGPAGRMLLIDTSLLLEAEHFAAGAGLRTRLTSATRSEILTWLRTATAALYGTGLISARQRFAILDEMDALAADEAGLQPYKRLLDYLGLVPGWSSATLALHLGEAVQKFASIEPQSSRFIPDQLRGSAMFFFAQALDVLQRDADRLAGVHNELYGDRVSGLHGLNPGIARGVLRFAAAADADADFDRDGIYVLPETVADLPPVAGIITAGAGNQLSHVQLLARNLGIPNVAVDAPVVAMLQPHAGDRILVAVSPGGSVVIGPADDGNDAVTPAAQPSVRITPDLAKLDLGFREIPTLDELNAEDSGRVVGPKAAKLAELRHHFADAVAPGVAIPFGEFRALLDQPKAGTEGSAFDWMVAEYAALAKLPPDSATRADRTEMFRQELESWVLRADPGIAFRDRLRTAMDRVFGVDGSYGVFVRSDTNVEDLPGFTGAGLNLTVPNVVGFDAVLEAISRVWASPFSARAFAWRQALMTEPQHVYPAVLLQLTVANEKSGVLITRDIDTGDDGWLSIAVNEGVGGAVDGQPAESLRIEMATGRIRLLAQASAAWRRAVPATGGVLRQRVSGADTVLLPDEAMQLIEFARTLPTRFPPIVDDRGQPAPADVEFGFLRGKLHLFQIRPFLESARARSNAYLAELDRALTAATELVVNLREAPAP